MSATLQSVPRPLLVLPANLTWLRVHNQFIVCAIVPKPEHAEKTNKFPVNPVTLVHPVSGKDPANWLSCDDAFALANELNQRGGTAYGVGFWLTDALGIWCLDVDSGLGANGHWLPAVNDLCRKLPGTAWEYSHSWRGMHGWGRCTIPIPAHETRHNDDALGLHLELYSRNHFMMLGTVASGEMQPSIALPAALGPLFPALSADDAAALDMEWTDAPNPLWHGPTDDDALITIALKSRSKLATMFPKAAKATFKQLWESDSDKLAKHFPSDNGGYNESQADQALACHLAFWTGNNCARMAELMERSGLARSKHGREDYMRITIGKACAWQKEFYNDGKGITPGTAVPESAISTGGITLSDFYAYLPQKSYLFVPTRDLWVQSGVNSSLPLVEGKFQPTEWLDRARPLHQMTWAPGEPMVIADKLVDKGGWVLKAGVNCFNLYRPPAPMQGDPSLATPWLDLLRFVYPNDWEHMVKWFAHRRQRPGEKINHALVLGGDPGIGKDSMLEPVKYAVGPWNFIEIKPANLMDEFNGWKKSVILRVSEARDMGDMTRYALYDATKTLLATPPDVLRCNEKNLREHEVFNVIGVIFTTNHKDGLYIDPKDRRHYIAYSERVRQDFREGYWPALWQWYIGGGLGHVVAYLDSVDLTNFDPKADPPKTSAFWAMVNAGRAPEDADMADAIDRLGNPPAVTVDMVTNASADNVKFLGWLRDQRNNRAIPHRFEAADYVPILNPDAKADGRWKVTGRRTPVYVRKALAESERITAARELCLKFPAPPPPRF